MIRYRIWKRDGRWNWQRLGGTLWTDCTWQAAMRSVMAILEGRL